MSSNADHPHSFTIPRTGKGRDVSGQSQAGTSGTRPVIPNPSANPHAVPVGAYGPQTSVVNIESAIKDFGEGKVSRGKTLALITQALAFTGDQHQDAQKEQAYNNYVAQLDELENAFKRDNERDNLSIEPAGSDTRSSVLSNSDAGSPVPHDRRVREGRKRKCGDRDFDEEGEDEDVGGSNDGWSDDEPKRKLKPSDMPWYHKEETAKLLRPSCAETARLIQLYAKDLKAVKRWITTSQTAPTGFPESEWDSIIQGRPVNLENAYGTHYDSSAPRKNIGSITDGKIELKTTGESRKVKTHGDWTIAWGKASRAIAFAFEHRREELDRYGEFMQGEFGARNPRFHERVIRFDQAIRNEVGGGTRLLLTDFDQFQRHRTAILSVDGIFAFPDEKPGGTTRAKINETCNRFNTNIGCPNGRSCKYKHICKKCGEGGHGATACGGGK